MRLEGGSRQRITTVTPSCDHSSYQQSRLYMWSKEGTPTLLCLQSITEILDITYLSMKTATHLYRPVGVGGVLVESQNALRSILSCDDVNLSYALC
jgi:hypothetical protein